jgi:TetR/AcrR family tetracycline transcriptional repressor
MTLPRARGTAGSHPRLTREEIVRVALRTLERDGLEQITLRRLAEELGVTAAAVSWHVRSKDELVDAIVQASLRTLRPPQPESGEWTGRLRELHTWFRASLLERRHLVFTPAFRRALPYAFVPVELAGTRILREAGVAEGDAEGASRLLHWHTIAVALNEAGAAHAPPPGRTPRPVLDGAIESLTAADFASFIERLPEMLDTDPDRTFAFGLDCLLRGLQRRLLIARSSRGTRARRPSKR